MTHWKSNVYYMYYCLWILDQEGELDCLWENTFNFWYVISISEHEKMKQIYWKRRKNSQLPWRNRGVSWRRETTSLPAPTLMRWPNSANSTSNLETRRRRLRTGSTRWNTDWKCKLSQRQSWDLKQIRIVSGNTWNFKHWAMRLFLIL